MQKGILAYNPANKRYGLMVAGELVIEGFHCGDSMQVYYAYSWHNTRIESNSDGYYLVGAPFKAGHLENVNVRL